MNITEFLEARIAEDEAVAQAATAGPWKWDEGQAEDESFLYAPDDVPVIVGYGMHTQGFLECSDADRTHIARYYPARVLAECAAKRAITKAHSNITVWPEGTGGAKYYTGSKEVCASCDERTQTPCPTIRVLAAVYKEHPEYQQEWGAQ